MCINHCGGPKHEKITASLGDGAGVREHLEVAPMHFWNAVWMATLAPLAGRELVGGLSSPSANVRAVAAMHLVNAGARSADVLREALDNEATLEQVLPVVVSVQVRDPSQILSKKLAQLSYSTDSEVRSKVVEALRHIRACSSRKFL